MNKLFQSVSYIKSGRRTNIPGKTIIAFILFTNLTFGQTVYQKDFEEFWKSVNENYAYFEKQEIDWRKVKDIYEPKVHAVTNIPDFVRHLELVINELHNGHSSLNTNLETSNRLVPSGADIFVEYIDNKYFITDLRKGFGAELCGLQTGMEIVKFNDRDIDEQLKFFLPKYTHNYNLQMIQYAISMLFAGTHDTKRKITVEYNGETEDYFPDDFKPAVSNNLLESQIIDGKFGYIKINNSLGNYELISAFDKALESLMSTEGLILDLTETPGGGNTIVARAIMGRFTDTKLPYQIHEVEEYGFDTKRSWIELVNPRKETYRGRLIVMVGHWTGSMGEGMAIGFDGMNKATIAGTKMAGLIGAIDEFTLSETGISFQIPTERLYHINGTPREEYIPVVLTGNTDDILEEVMKILKTDKD